MQEDKNVWFEVKVSIEAKVAGPHARHRAKRDVSMRITPSLVGVVQYGATLEEWLLEVMELARKAHRKGEGDEGIAYETYVGAARLLAAAAGLDSGLPGPDPDADA